MMHCGFCGCELSEPEPFCEECVEILNACMEHQESVSSDTKED